MGRIIGTILGVILAIWLACTAAGEIFATVKTFLIIGPDRDGGLHRRVARGRAPSPGLARVQPPHPERSPGRG